MELVGVRGLCDNIFVFNNMYKFVIKIKDIFYYFYFLKFYCYVLLKKNKLICGFLINF